MKRLFVISPLILMLSVGIVMGGQQGEKPCMERLNVEGAVLTYYAEGEGIPCVVLTGSENIGLKLYSKELKRHIRFIHADPKSVSKEDIKNFTLDTVLDDIEKVRKALGLEKIAVMGHSMFSVVPLEYAYKYPESVSYAIATGGVPYFSAKTETASKEYWEKEASAERKEILRKNKAELTPEVMNKLSPGEAFKKEYLSEVPMSFYDAKFNMADIWAGVDINMDFINKYWGSIYGAENVAKYKSIKAPVLIISGRYDFWCPYFMYDEVKDIIPNYSFIFFEKSGHNPMLEVPEEFDKKLLDWVKSH